MKVSPRLKHAAVTLAAIVLVAVLAGLSYWFRYQVDITRSSSNSLSEATQKLLSSLNDKVVITAYIKKEAGIRRQIEHLIESYQYFKKDVVLNFVDPTTVPDKVRELSLGSDGGILVQYKGRTERLIYIDEVALTNALFQLVNDNERWVSFLSGHGERAADGVANFDLGLFGKALDLRKIRARSLNLGNMPVIPDNTNLLVLSMPAVSLMSGELEVIKQYIDKGGNLLVLLEPNKPQLDSVLQQLGIRVLDGVLVDGKAQVHGLNDPSFVVVSEYLKHPITKGFQMTTVFPKVAALEPEKTSPFEVMPILISSKQSWTELSELSGKIRYDAGSKEQIGPLYFGYALTRDFDKTKQQRVVVLGDGDFLSNTYLGNVGNLDFGFKVIHWLVHDDAAIDIPAKVTPDSQLQLSKMAVIVISFGVLFILPLGLLATGFLVWRRRNRK